MILKALVLKKFEFDKGSSLFQPYQLNELHVKTRPRHVKTRPPLLS